MKIKNFMIMAKALDYQKDPNPDNWVTMKGSHVHLENGKIDGGAGGKFNGQSYKGTKKQAHSGKSSEEKTENKADLEKRLKELKSKRDEHYWTITRSNSANKTESAGKELAKVDTEIAEIEKKLGKRKEFHELTKEQARRAHGMPESKHKERVEKALKEGKTVPENVLADYPDLKEKYGKKEPAAKNGKSDVGEKGLAYLRSISHVNSSAEEETGYTARTMIDMINKGKTLEEIRTELRKNIDKYSHDTDNDYQHLDKMIEAVKRADEAKEPAGIKDVRVKLPNGVTLRWREVPGEPDKVYNPETHMFYHLKGGIEAAIEKAKSQGATIEDYEKSPSDPYQAESKNRQDRKLARSAAATRRASKRGRPPGAR